MTTPDERTFWAIVCGVDQGEIVSVHNDGHGNVIVAIACPKETNTIMGIPVKMVDSGVSLSSSSIVFGGPLIERAAVRND